MIDKTKEELEEAIGRELATLKDTSPDSDEYSETIKNLDVLYRLKIEENTAVNDDKRSRIDRYLRYGLEFLGIVLPIWSYGRWAKMCFKFEETGAIMSTGGKGITKLFSPKRIKIR